jgi:hypothetical protein
MVWLNCFRALDRKPVENFLKHLRPIKAQHKKRGGYGPVVRVVGSIGSGGRLMKVSPNH